MGKDYVTTCLLCSKIANADVEEPPEAL
jgi:hypothetical protein